MSFNNLYYRRTAGTAKACYVCFKPTTTVLATINTTDFLYACPNHLQDNGFASLVDNGEKAAKAALTAEDIAKVKAEWEEKQKKKAEKQKKEKEEKEKEKDKDKEKDQKDEVEPKDKDRSNSRSPTVGSPSTGTSTPSSSSSHEKYTLHRDFFTMRLAEHRKRRQTAQAKALAPQLPSAPQGTL